MKVTNAVLLCAALLADSTSAAVRREILNRHNPRQFTSSSYDLEASTQDVVPSTPTSPSAEPTDFTSQPVLLSDVPQPSTAGDKIQVNSVQRPTTSIRLESSPTSQPATNGKESDDGRGNTISNTISNTAAPTTATKGAGNTRNGTHKTTQTTAIDTADAPEETSEPDVDFDPDSDWDDPDLDPDSSVCSEFDDDENCVSDTQTTATKTFTVPTNSSTFATTTTTEDPCTPFPWGRPLIQYSIVYTSTVTFYGNQTDYTPPYEPIKTPDYCTVKHSPTTPTPTPTSQWSNSSAPAGAPLPTKTKVFGPVIPLLPIPTIITPIVVITTPNASKLNGGLFTITLPPLPMIVPQVITFITTEKNPSVVFPTQPVPNYSQTFITIGDGFNPGAHRTVENIEETTPTVTPGPKDSVKLPPKPTFSVIAGGNTVIINDKTYTGLQPGKTTTVTVDRGTFTLMPTAVEGMGSTVTKPPPQETGIPTPTTQIVGGVPVTVSGTKAIIDGSTVNLPTRAVTMTTIGGHQVTLAPGNVAIGTDTLTYAGSAPHPTDQIVSGGDLVTAIGRSVVVLHSRTITYGTNIPESTTVVSGETITIGPSGVSFHGTTLGGPSAQTSETDYEIIGGVTVGRLPDSRVVINGQTFTLDPTGTSRTTVINGETITIGNDGLVVSSMTMTYPSEAFVTATIEPSGTWTDTLPTQTGGDIIDVNGSGDDSGAFSTRPNIRVTSVVCLCIAFGVWIMG